MTGIGWETRLNGQRWAVRSGRVAAMNAVDKRPYKMGFAEVENLATGELWERRRGVWAKIRERRPEAAA